MIKCPHCGGEMEFKAGTQKVTCPYCRSDFDPTNLEVKVKTSKKKDNPLSATGKSYTCAQCGATLMTFDDTAITFCSYCGSQAMLDDVVTEKLSPDLVIPFAKTKEECINEYKSIIKKNFLVPDYMKDDVVIEKFRGIYMPYAVYNLEFHGINTAKGSKYAYRSGDYVYYNDYKINADLDVQYNGISFDLSSNFYDKYSKAIPFNNKESKAFNPNYMVGFYADNSNVDGAIYDYDAEAITKADSRKRLFKNREYSQYNVTSANVDLDVTDRKMAFFPVYFLAIRDKKNENVSYAVINGQTGKVAIDLPVSFKKYVILSLILSVIMFVLINSFVVLTPTKVAIYAAIFSFLSFILATVQASKIKKKLNHEDDKGYSATKLIEEANKKEENKDEKKEEPKKEKFHGFKYSYKALIGFLLPVLLVLLNLVQDSIYYGASIISLALVLLSFKDLVKEHNMLTTRKLPQLNKRGGDENA